MTASKGVAAAIPAASLIGKCSLSSLGSQLPLHTMSSRLSLLSHGRYSLTETAMANDGQQMGEWTALNNYPAARAQFGMVGHFTSSGNYYIYAAGGSEGINGGDHNNFLIQHCHRRLGMASRAPCRVKRPAVVGHRGQHLLVWGRSRFSFIFDREALSCFV